MNKQHGFYRAKFCTASVMETIFQKQFNFALIEGVFQLWI